MHHPRYKQLTEWLFDQIPLFQNEGASAYKPGLERVTKLAEAFRNPHTSIPTIHVAGTNGKGSTSSMLAAVMTSSGRKTGLFTSPHLLDFRERIRIDGQMISEAEVVDFIDRYRALSLEIEPSFFELTTVMAFDHFRRHNVDCAIIEVGLGGRLDSTNIITPVLSVITNISLDHTALLGTTCEAIACEKAGIIKPGIPVVIGSADGAIAKVFSDIAANRRSPVVFADQNKLYQNVVQLSDNTLLYTDTPWGDIVSPLTGDYQPENVNTVLNALKVLPFTVSSAAVCDGMAHVGLLSGLVGRWMKVSDNPVTICDTGHNPGGWQYLGPRLQHIADTGDLHVVIGFVNDKDISAILGYLPRNARYYFATPSVKRGRPAADVADTAAAHGIAGTPYDTVTDAYKAALNAAGDNDTIFVGGSTFIVADFLAG